jgi:hypothetical protein
VTLKALLVLALAVPVRAVPIGAADPTVAPATGFPGAYLQTVSLSLTADPLYGSRFLDAFQYHVQTVAGMTSPRAVAAYLEQAVTAGAGPVGDYLRPRLGREALDPPKASALLLANALSRPRQAREVLDGLETLRAGLGRHAARILREASGAGDRDLLAALRAAGAREPRGEILTYGRDGRLDKLFDGMPTSRGFGAREPDGVVDATGVAPRPRDTRYALTLPPRR